MRQVEALQATVVTCSLNADGVRAAGLTSPIISLTGGRPLRGSLVMRAWKRLVRRFGAGGFVEWSRDARERWRVVLREQKPDVVLAQFGPNAIRAAAGCREAGVPLVVHFHGYDLSSLIRDPGYLCRLRSTVPRLAAVVVVSREQERVLRDIVGRCPPTTLIPYGVPVDEFQPASMVNRQPCQFLAVGRFVPKKAPLATLEAFARCAERCPGARLTMIGEGPLLGEAGRWVAGQEMLRAVVALLGRQPNETVRRAMAEAGCFVQHSVRGPDGDSEGWPVAIAEAAACALPVVATRHAGIPDQVVDGVGGFLVGEGDVASMSDRMSMLAGDPELRVKMGAAAREHIVQHGSFCDSLKKLHGVLSAAARGRDRAD